MVRAADGSLLREGLAELARNPRLLAVLLGAYAAAFVLRALAWRALLGPVGRGAGPGPEMARLVAILHAALFANHALPVKAGEVLRPALAARAGVPIADATASTVVARLLDVAALLAIAAALLPLTTTAGEGPLVLAVPALLLAAVAGALLWIRSTTFGETRIAMLDRVWLDVWLDLWLRVREALRAIPPRAVLRAFVLTAPSWLLESVVVYGAAQFGPGALLAFPAVTGLPSLGRIRASREDSKRAGRFEIVAARLWNVLNEGKPFTPVFVLGTLLLLGVPHLTDGGYWLRQLVALIALAPLFVVFYRYAFPLRLRAVLWVLLAVAMVGFRAFDVASIALVLTLFFGFTVVLWGSMYYHLRIGTPWTNGLRFWRLVLENPDPTSGNFLEQVPKLLILVLLSGFLVDHPGALSIAAVEVFTATAAVLAVLSHQWWFTWAPPDPLAPTRLRNTDRGPLARRDASSSSSSTAVGRTASPRRVHRSSTASPPRASSALTCARCTRRAP